MEKQAYLDKISQLLVYPRPIPYRSLDEETAKTQMDDHAKNHLFQKFIAQIAEEHLLVCFEDSADLVLSLLQLDEERFALNENIESTVLDLQDLPPCFKNAVVLQPVFGINHHGDWVLNNGNSPLPIFSAKKDAITVWVFQEKIIDQNLLDTFVINKNAIAKGSIVAIQLG